MIDSFECELIEKLYSYSDGKVSSEPVWFIFREDRTYYVKDIYGNVLKQTNMLKYCHEFLKETYGKCRVEIPKEEYYLGITKVTPSDVYDTIETYELCQMEMIRGE